MLKGWVVAAYGRQYGVEIEGRIQSCIARGRKVEAVVGDWVQVSDGVIESVMPRTSLLYRSDAFREKRIAANVTQVVFVLAGVPTYSELLLNLCLVAAQDQGLKFMILLNKADMEEATRTAGKALELYKALGYRVLTISAKRDVSPLLPFLENETSVFVGQSGMGKSTLINSLIPEAKRETGEISSALDSGRHTTTHARLFHLSESSHVIDSPGLQEFGLNHLDLDRVFHAFIEFRPFIGHCRFRNCRHLNEPGCALDAALEKGAISARRMAVYRMLAEEIISRDSGKGRARNK